MKKLTAIILIGSAFFFTSCFQDPLYGIRRISRSSKLEDKEKASELYKQAIDTMVDAYSSYSGLNRDIGLRLMKMQQYEPAIQHLEVTVSIKNNDSSAYYWLATCYSHLYKIRKEPPLMINAEKNFKTALNITPDNREYNYVYAQFLVFVKEDYQEAINHINKHIDDMINKAAEMTEKSSRQINPSLDANLYFLLGRSYYMLEQYTDALNTFNRITEIEKHLSKEQKNSLENFIIQTRKMIDGE